MKTKYYILLPYLSALLIGLPFIHVNLSLLGMFGFIPIIAYLSWLRKDRKPYAYLNLFAGLFFFQAIVLGWMLTANPSRWLPIEQSQSILLMAIVWLHATILMSSGYVFFVLAARWLNKRKMPELYWIFLISASWAVAEFVRAYITSIGVAGQDSIFSPVWNHGSLGYIAMNLPIAFGSRFVGLYGSSFGLLLINFGVYKLLKQEYRQAIFLIAPVFIISALGLAVYSQNDKTLSVSAVHIGLQSINNNQVLDFNQFNSAVSQQEKTDLMVFPEVIDPTAGDKPVINLTSDYIKDGGAIVSGRRQRPTYPTENLQVYFNNHGEEVATTEKWFIVPYGEYVPYFIEKILSAAGMSDLVSNFRSSEQIIAGTEQAQPVEVDDLIIGGQVCSGISVPSIYHFSARNGAEILTNSANLSHFAFSPQYHQQALLMAKYHAIANSRPYVQATKSGQSLILSADGDILSETSSAQAIEIINAEAQTRNQRTLASILDNYTMLLILVPAAYMLFVSKRTKKI